MGSLYEACNAIEYTGNFSYLIGSNNIVMEATFDKDSIIIGSNTSLGSSSHHNIVLIKSREIIINNGVTLTVASPKKSLVLFCDTLINNGTISMTGKGPYTTPHDYHIINVADNIFSQNVTIPAYANNAAARISGWDVNGRNGNNGTNRQCGSGGTGRLSSNNSGGGKYVGASGMGYAFGGGAGSGGETGTSSSAIHDVSTSMPMVGGAGYSYSYYAATGGVGQPAGANSPKNTYWDYSYGSSAYLSNQNVGVGGRIIIFCNNFTNNGKIEANGVNAVSSYVWGGASGGASGGGAVDVFYRILTSRGTITANGGLGAAINSDTTQKSGNGGNGSITLSVLVDDVYVEEDFEEPEPEPRPPIVIRDPSLKNTNIYKNPEDRVLFDLSNLGTLTIIDNQEVVQRLHRFQVGDVIYYDVKQRKFALAIANNTIESEVVGVVSNIINEDRFNIINTGMLVINKYTFPTGTQLYLSNSTSGKLVSIQPGNVIKPIATQSNNGIIINIERGWIPENPTSDDIVYENCTKEDLDEIIRNIWQGVDYVG